MICTPMCSGERPNLSLLLSHMRNMPGPSIITPEDYHDIFGTSDKENSDVDAEGSDIDVPEVDSDEEVEEDVQESDNEDNAADTIGKEAAWSNELADFVITRFNDQPGIKVEVPEEPRSDFFCATQQMARHNSPRSESLFRHMPYHGNNLPRLAIDWSSDPFIGNTGIQNVVTKNRFEELSQYLHFSNSATEPQRGDDNYDHLYKVRPVLSKVLENVQKAYEPSQNLSIDEQAVCALRSHCIVVG